MKKNKKVISIIIIMLIIALGIGGYFLYNVLNKEKAEDKYENIVEQNLTYIHYHFDFTNAKEDDHKYNIKDYEIIFDTKSDENDGFKINNNQVNSIAKIYDVYYIKNNKNILIIDTTDFGIGMHVAMQDDLKNVSDFLEGIFSIKDFKVKGNILKFDAMKYSSNYIIASKSAIFNLCVDNYQDYVEDEYVVLANYEYDLSNKEFSEKNFKITPKMNIKELYESSENACKKIDNTDILDLEEDELENDVILDEETSEEE